MTRKSRVILAGALVTAGGISALAAAGGDMGGKGFWGWGGMHGHRSIIGLKRLDGDNDGAVTRDEFLKRTVEAFNKLDANHDGKVDAAELRAPMDERAEFRSKRFLKSLDADGDGKVSKEEFEKGPRERFAAEDLNSDGKITSDERPHRRHFGWGWGGKGKDRAKGEDKEWTLDKTLELTDARFKDLDTNGDGFIDAAELTAQAGARSDEAVKRMLHRQDKDKDGTISQAEFTARTDKRFATLDLNGDGKITAEDLPSGDREAWERKWEHKR